MSELTEPQLEVLRLIAAGRTTKEIARELQTSFGGVRGLRGRAIAALGASSSAHAVAIAYERGILGGGR